MKSADPRSFCTSPGVLAKNTRSSLVRGRAPHDFCACARHSCELMATNGQEGEKAQEMFTQLSQIEGAALSTWGNSDT